MSFLGKNEMATVKKACFVNQIGIALLPNGLVCLSPSGRVQTILDSDDSKQAKLSQEYGPSFSYRIAAPSPTEPAPPNHTTVKKKRERKKRGEIDGLINPPSR